MQGSPDAQVVKQQQQQQQKRPTLLEKIKQRPMRFAVIAALALAVVGGAAAAAGATLASHMPAAQTGASAVEKELPCCVPLGSNMQLRYAVNASAGRLELALIGALNQHAWMSWGPADPRATNRLMGSADVIAGGFSDINSAPWVSDFFLSSYTPCDLSDPPSGTCPDSALNINPKTGAVLAKTPAAALALNNVKLVSASRADGITTLRVSRPLAAADVLDHKIDPAAALNYIWAHGQLSAPDPAATPQARDPAVRLRQHGSSRDAYGEMEQFKLSSCPKACPKLVPSGEKDPPPPPPPVAPAPAAAKAADVGPLLLAGNGARVSWELKKGAAGASGVLFSFKAAKKSQWASLAIGEEMVGARSYIVWKDGKTGALKSGVYDLESYKAAGIKLLPPPPAAGPTASPHGGVVSMAAGKDGLLSFDAWVPLPPGAKTLPLLWALGDDWTQPPKEVARHYDWSSKATKVDVTVSRAAAPPKARKVMVAPPNCTLKHQSEILRLGDGWCDELAPYNTPECAYDGGDCCNAKAPFYDCRDPKSPLFGKASPRGLRLPAPRNPRYTEGMGRVLSTKQLVTTYNNFYEFSTDKNAYAYVTPEARQAMELANPKFGGWAITIDGLVAKPMKLDVRDIINMFHIEERIYRHRCVEAWAIVVPWIGFPLRKLVTALKPLPGAKYIRFETDTGPYLPNIKSAISPNAPWPYVEGLATFEAMNDLAFVSIGQFNSTLTAQSGGPIRLNLPWKYGFKSVKSIRRISFVADQPVNYWNAFSPDEYGFWANINPKVPHPRWLQSSEQILVDSPKARGFARTLLFNNYTDEVAYMYGDPSGANRTQYF